MGLITNKRGVEVLRDRKISKSTSFTKEERQELGLRGLLPYSVGSQQKQINRVMTNIRRKESDIEKYIFLSALQDRNEQLFYKTIMQNFAELLPIIYTPTVGQVCKEFSQIYRNDKGFFITPEDKGEIRQILDNWPEKEVKVVVITDGQRILGLGDLGANGMGIPIGKLSLYVAGGGIRPEFCMPIMFDVGTNNEAYLDDLLYLGYPHKRMVGEPYFELLDEFILAIRDKFPDVLIQFEDFLTPNAYEILNKYQNQILCFNDDIQGTAAVALGGVLSASRISGIPFKDSTILFLGAGSAATGIADLMVSALISEGLSEEEAHRRLWFVDIHGLLVKSRTDLLPHNLPYAHDAAPMNFIEAIKYLRPNILIGASGAGGTFTQEVIELMSEINHRPVIFALSNPTSKSECTAAEVYTYSNGSAIFASGSPFAEFERQGKTYTTAQGNNVYIFPGIGLACIGMKPSHLPDDIFMVAASALANCIDQSELDAGRVYPNLTKLRFISLEIAKVVSLKLLELGLTKISKPADLHGYLEALMYNPEY